MSLLLSRIRDRLLFLWDWRNNSLFKDCFDEKFYLDEYDDIANKNVDPFKHFMIYGWREGRNPSQSFDTNFYLSAYRDVRQSKVNPFYHYMKYGRKEGRICNSERKKILGVDLETNTQLMSISEQLHLAQNDFDEDYYLSKYPEIVKVDIDPLEYYMTQGWREGHNPSSEFDTVAYLLAYSDVRQSGINPFLHYLCYGKQENRFGKPHDLVKQYFLNYVPHHMQDISFPPNLEKSRAIIAILVPEHDTMSGGIYSLFSIAKQIYDMRTKHEFDVVVMTRPNNADITYLRQKNFRNYEDVFRFSQLKRCKSLEKLLICIPEYATEDFYNNLDTEMIEFLRSRSKLYINIMNQNIELMPDPKQFSDIYKLGALEVTQSVAHHAYFNQECADRYNLPTLLLPAYTDLSGYPPLNREEKEKLIIYSPDEKLSHRNQVLTSIKKELSDFKLIEIKDMSFDKFMDLATRCMFSISFGEGFDGYIAQPIYQGGIGLTIYREEFFPSSDFKKFKNIFEDEEDMITNIITRIREFEKDDKMYRETNKELLDIYNSLYSIDNYRNSIMKLISNEFEIHPGHGVNNLRLCR